MSGIDILNSLQDRGIDFGSSVVITGTATLDASAMGKVIVCSGTSADYTVGLPAASESKGKRVVLLMDSALTKLVTLDGNSSETIDGAASRVMWAGESAELWSDGVSWKKVSGKSLPMSGIVRMLLATTPSIPSNTWTTVPWDSVVHDPCSLWDSVNYCYTLKRGGLYFLQFCGSNQSTSAGVVSGVISRLNNTVANITPSYSSYGAAGANPAPFSSGWYFGNITDKLATKVYFFNFTAAMFGNSGPFTITESTQW